MTATVLVTGGTGTLGHQVVRRLLAAGHDVRVLSRHSGPVCDGVEHVTSDLLNGERVEPGLDGVGIIVHCAGARTGDEKATLNLVRAASRAKVSHIVYISVIGADRIPLLSGIDRVMFGYFGSKFAAERVVAESGLPWTTLRAGQFFEAFLMIGQQIEKLPVLPIPAGFRFQPVDAGEVAGRLVELAIEAPSGLVPEMGGPRIYAMGELLRQYLQARGKRRLMVPLWIPGQAARAFRAGANLASGGTAGQRTWEAFLAERVGSSNASGT